jgi:hypothetical protein
LSKEPPPTKKVRSGDAFCALVPPILLVDIRKAKSLKTEDRARRRTGGSREDERPRLSRAIALAFPKSSCGPDALSAG